MGVGTRAWGMLWLASCSPAAPPEGLLYSGCHAVQSGPTCLTADGRVTLWLPPGSGELRISGGSVVSDQPMKGGRTVTAQVEGEGAVRLAQGWRMRVRRAPTDAAPCPDDPSGLGAAERGRCQAAAARRAFDGGDPAEAIRLHGLAADALGEAGLAREQGMAQVRRAFARVDGGDVTPAAVDLQPTDPADAAWFFTLELARAEQALTLGDIGRAMRAYELALDVATRSDHAERIVAVMERMALLQVRVGRFDTALELYARSADQPGAGPCWTIDRQVARAWGVLGIALAGGEAEIRRHDPEADPAAWLDAAFVGLSAAGEACQGRNRLADVQVDRALAAVIAGDLEGAAAALAAMPQARNADTGRWATEVEARLLLARGLAEEAAERWRRAGELAERAGDVDLQWRALDGLARAARARGALVEAAGWWQAAEQLLADQAVLVPLRLGRGTFFDARYQAASEHVDLLLGLGRPSEAFDAARSWRSALLRSAWAPDAAGLLDDTARRSWEEAVSSYGELRRRRASLAAARASAPADEVGRLDAELGRVQEAEAQALDTGRTALGWAPAARGPREGELLVTAFRRMGPGGASWVPLARDRAGVHVGRAVGESDLRADPGALLAALGAPVDRAGAITLLLPGALEEVDVHAGVAGRVPVSWSVDLPAVAPPTRLGRALVVADPGGGLAEARAEGQAVAALLRTQGMAVQELGLGTTGESLLAALGTGVDLLHFAGHGEFGRDGWMARLKLGDDTSFGLRDVLSLERPPALVVLAGCETARTLPIGVAELGLAQTFVQVGSTWAVASVREVDDGVARALSEAFHAARPLEVGPPVAFQRALAALAADGSADWRAFRLTTR